MDTGWPFADPPDAEGIALGRVLRGESPLRLVTHDEDDGCWQFLDGDHAFEDEAVAIELGTMLQFDPSLAELADLLPGWYAWRESLAGPWQRAEGEPPDDLFGAR